MLIRCISRFIFSKYIERREKKCCFRVVLVFFLLTSEIVSHIKRLWTWEWSKKNEKQRQLWKGKKCCFERTLICVIGTLILLNVLVSFDVRAFFPAFTFHPIQFFFSQFIVCAFLSHILALWEPQTHMCHVCPNYSMWITINRSAARARTI